MIVVQLLIELSSRQLCVHEVKGDTVIECHPIAIGKASTPTPPGVYTVQSIHPYPELISFKTGKNLGRGILGSFSINLGSNPLIPGTTLAIHGTNQPGLVGQAVSHGCIRMVNEDIEHLVLSYYFNKVTIQ